MYCDDDDDDEKSDIRPHSEEPLISIMMWLNNFITQSSQHTRISLFCLLWEATTMLMIIDCISVLMDDYVAENIGAHVIDPIKGE